MLERFGCFDDVDVNALMSDKCEENMESLAKQEKSLICVCEEL